MAYDTSTANPVNPQGTAGGGNVFNAGSVFGSQLVLGATGGTGDAGTGSSDTAALGGPANGGSVVPLQAAATSAMAALLNSPVTILAIGGVLVFGLGLLVFHRFKRK